MQWFDNNWPYWWLRVEYNLVNAKKVILTCFLFSTYLSTNAISWLYLSGIRIEDHNATIQSFSMQIVPAFCLPLLNHIQVVVACLLYCRVFFLFHWTISSVFIQQSYSHILTYDWCTGCPICVMCNMNIKSCMHALHTQMTIEFLIYIFCVQEAEFIKITLNKCPFWPLNSCRREEFYRGRNERQISVGGFDLLLWTFANN